MATHAGDSERDNGYEEYSSLDTDSSDDEKYIYDEWDDMMDTQDEYSDTNPHLEEYAMRIHYSKRKNPQVPKYVDSYVKEYGRSKKSPTRILAASNVNVKHNVSTCRQQ